MLSEYQGEAYCIDDEEVRKQMQEELNMEIKFMIM